jgi:hypothetical protein
MSIAEKLQTIAENEQRVYEAGKKAEYDAFWDAYQQNGAELIDYTGAFAGPRWTKDTLTPKYDIVPDYGAQIFWANAMEIDLAQHLENCGVKLDFSKSYSAGSAFAYSYFTRIGEITLNINRSYINMFNGCSKLKVIDKITVADGADLRNAFNDCTSLESVIFDGIINKNGYNLQWSTKLSKASITSIINALSTTTTGLTITFSKTAKEAAFTDEEWAALIATRTNWTISLV